MGVDLDQFRKNFFGLDGELVLPFHEDVSAMLDELAAAREVVEAVRCYLDDYLKHFPDTADDAPNDHLRGPLVAYDRAVAGGEGDG